MPDRCSYSGRTMTSTAAAAASATTQRFDRHVSNATCRLVEINEHLLCALCSGYLVDATTIIECLHTFCRSCIVRYLESSETCPVCDVPLHQTNPLLGIRADTTLQTLVYKLVPGVFKDEVKRRCTVINNAHADGKSSSIMDRLLKDICDMTTGGTIYTADEQFSVCLQYAPSFATSSPSDARYGKPCSKSSCAVSQQDLAECSYLLCPASVTVAHLKKLIRNKLELSSDLPLDLYHSSPDGSLDDVYTLADVAYITAWTSVKPLHFYYQVNAKPSQTAVKKISPVSEETDCKRKVAHGSRAEKLPGGACLKRVITNNRQNVKVKGVICSSVNKKASKVAAKKVKSPPGECLASQIPKASSRESSFSAETSPISVETKELDQKSDLKDNCGRKQDCDSQDGKAAKVILDEQNGVKSVRDLDSKETANIQTKSSERNSIELTESEVTDIEIGQKTSSRTVENETPKPSPNQKKSGLSDCSPSADSALSPSRPETVSQSAMTVDGFDTMSDAEGNAIDSASSPPPPTKRMKIAEPNDRNLFAAINSMIVNSNNDNVVSSSTSSQASTDDSGDNKTSVETQTSAKLIGRCSKKGKPRTKKDSIVKSRSMKQIDSNDHARVLPPTSTASVVALSADTSSQSISVATHTYSTAVDTTTQQCTSATLCVPICINEKTGGGSNLILNLPQNVSVQCRIRSDKILIASNPTTTAANPDVASSTFNSISYNQTTTISAKSPAPPITQSRPSPTSLTSEASPTLTSQASPSLTSEASPTLTSQAALAVRSPAQPIIASSGQPNRSSVTRTSLAAPSMTSSMAPNVKSPQLSDDNRIASPLPRQLNTRTITENNGNVCNNRVTSAGECQVSGKEVPVKRGAVKRTVSTSDTSLRFRNKDRCNDCPGEVPVQSTIPGKSGTVGSASTCVSPSPVRCVIPITRSPEIVPSNASSLAKPPCESNVSIVAAKPTCPKSALGQKEATVTKVPCCATATNRDVDPIRDKTPQNVATASKQNPGPTNVCKTISRPKEVVPPATTTSVVSANSVTAATSSGVSTTKAVLFKPYQITTTTTSHVTSPKRSADGITATATFQGNTHHNVLYSNPTFPIFFNSQYPKDQPGFTHQADIFQGVRRDSVLASTASVEMTNSGMPAVHRTMSNIPLHSVIKVPTYTARKMPQNKKTEKKGSRSPRNESSSIPVASVSILRKPESCLGSQETLGQKGGLKSDEIEGKLIDRPASDYVREMPVSKGSQSGDRNVALQATIPKGIQDDLSHGKVDEGWNQARASSSSIRSCLKLPLVSADILDKGDSSSCSISTSSLNEQSALPTNESETVPKTPLIKKRFDLPGPSSSGSDHRHSPKRRSEKTCPTDEMSYTCAEADSGTSPGAVSLSPPRCGSKNDAPPGGLSPNLLQQSSATGSSLRKKLVIDLERCSPRQGKASSGANCTPSPAVSTSFDQRPHCCSPTTTTIPPADPPLSGGQATPPRLVISLPRCQIPAPTTLLSPSGGCQSQWSPTSSGTDNSPPTTKRLKLMCNGMTIYRTLESPGSRSPRRTSGGGGSSSRRSSPVSAPVGVDCPLTLLSRASSCKSPSPPQSKCRRKSNSSTPVLSTGMEPKSVVVTGGDPVVVVSVDSTSTSPRTAATTVSLSNDNGLFTVMTPWKVHERSSVSLTQSVVEEPLELTTKEVKERQKEREYAKLMSNLRPPSAFTT